VLVYLQLLDLPEERSKFEQIYDHYRNLMYHVAYDVLGNVQDAEDAVQIAFVKIAKNIHKVQEVGQPKTTGYIVTIARNSAIDLYRKRKTIPLELDQPLYSEEFRYDEGLVGCILRLPERHQAVLLLKYYHGYRNEEIAELLDLSLSNVSKIDQRAKKALEALCREEELL